MKASKGWAHGSLEAAPEETIPEASRSFKAVQLRLLMKEREDVVSRLVKLDYSIWVLEEFLRTQPASSSGTPVPRRSLSLRRENPGP